MKYWALIVVAIGLAILFVGNSIANIGASVDRLVASKWTGVALLVIGAILFVASDASLKLKLERSI